jgi:POT family proton-dependent oligopeptide transporter
VVNPQEPPSDESSKAKQILGEKDEIVETVDDEEPTDHEKATLRHVGESLPWACWLVAIVEFCERFTYYGMQGLFQNYCKHKPDGSQGSKGLGYDKTGATGLNQFFSFWCKSLVESIMI